MVSETPAPENVEKVYVPSNVSDNRSSKGKIPKRVHKAEREKMKREHLNELFIELGNALELTQQNNGKASILCETSRLLKDLFDQIESLKKENASLISESRDVTIEKKELKEENSALETQIEKLQNEIEARVAQCKPDLNIPPLEFQQSELMSHFPGHGLGMPAGDALQQAPAVLVVPLHRDLQAYPATDITQPMLKPPSHVSKPHARYPTPADSWPSQLLREQPLAGKEFICRGSDDGVNNSPEQGR